MSAAKLAKLRRALLHRIAGPEVLSEALSALSSLGASVRRLGVSEGGRPIYAVSVGRGPIRVLSVCRMHGNEPAPTNASLLFLLDLLTGSLRDRGLWADDVLRSVTVHVVPVANPDGAELYYELSRRVGHRPSWANVFSEARGDSLGYDINRDWMRLRLRETRLLHALATELSPHVVLDHHEFYYKGNYPPLWPEDFMLTMTDAPYRGVHPEVKAVSSELLSRVARAVRLEGLGHWRLKERHFTGGSVGAGEELVVRPTALGSHLPYEGSAKLLVETWGVGLGEYLLSDRVAIHYLALAEAARLAVEGRERLEGMRRAFEESEMSREEREYAVRGAELAEARALLSLHGVRYSDAGGELVVRVPQPRSTMALLLLDPDFELNALIRREFGAPVTLSTFLRVEVERRLSLGPGTSRA